MDKELEVTVITPAYNEEENIASFLERLIGVMQACGKTYEIIVIDDASKDRTPEIAKNMGVHVISHPHNIGNGAAIKTGIRNARGKVIVMLDADGQHPPEDIPRLLEKIDTYHMVVGARSKESDTSKHRDLANAVYNTFATYICNFPIQDLTSGFRAVRANIARQFLYMLPNQFSYPTTLTLAVLRSGYSLAYVPIVGAKRKGVSKIRIMHDGPKFFLILMRIATLFAPMKIFFPVSLLMFVTGITWGIFKVLFLHVRYGPTSAMLMTIAVLIFLVGLVSEQVTLLRYGQGVPPYEPECNDWNKDI